MITLSLLVTCIYSEEGQKKEEKDKSMHHMENTERMKLCFAKMEGRAFPNEKEALIKWDIRNLKLKNGAKFKNLN